MKSVSTTIALGILGSLLSFSAYAGNGGVGSAGAPAAPNNFNSCSEVPVDYTARAIKALNLIEVQGVVPYLAKLGIEADLSAPIKSLTPQEAGTGDPTKLFGVTAAADGSAFYGLEVHFQTKDGTELVMYVVTNNAAALGGDLPLDPQVVVTNHDNEGNFSGCTFRILQTNIISIKNAKTGQTLQLYPDHTILTSQRDVLTLPRQ